MKYRIQFTLTAEQDLRDIAFHVMALSCDVQTTLRFVEGLQKSVLHLDDFPHSGAVPKDRFLIHLGLRYVLHEEYLIFYKTDEQEKTIFVVAVLNGNSDYVKALKHRV